MEETQVQPEPKYEISEYEKELFALGFVRSVDNNHFMDEAIYTKKYDNDEVTIKFKAMIRINGVSMLRSIKSKYGVEHAIEKALQLHRKVNRKRR